MQEANATLQKTCDDITAKLQSTEAELTGLRNTVGAIDAAGGDRHVVHSGLCHPDLIFGPPRCVLPDDCAYSALVAIKRVW